MGLLDNTTHKDYYEGSDLGNYQFTSLDDIITQFEIGYVGEGKIISNAKRIDIAFHAQRALQELSFDTFKSCKSQQITVPSNLTMPLPHDYVNYTKLTWVDSSGIEHIIYPTDKTSNPFQIRQENDGEYSFPAEYELLINNDFSSDFANPWKIGSSISHNSNLPPLLLATPGLGVENGVLQFFDITSSLYGVSDWGWVQSAYQKIDVSNLESINISADGTAVNNAVATNNLSQTETSAGIGTIRFGIMSDKPKANARGNVGAASYGPGTWPSPNLNASVYNLLNIDGEASYVEWTNAETGTKTKNSIDVSNYNEVYVVVISFVTFSAGLTANYLATTNFIDNVSVTNADASEYLQSTPGNEMESSTWQNYKSATPSENQDDYQDDTYWPINGSRYGLDPQHAQANGSFYIDCMRGKIHFSSNISGKAVILKYISDSLGTDAEMQVHKFAEEAIYKWIAYGILSAKINISENIIRRFKKEKFAETRKAKLRLSNIKLEEITQILRGKSKQIKH